MKSIREEVKAGQVLISDGAWGTFLQQKGLQPGECPELWNIEHRADVLDIPRAYLKAGAMMVKSNSFGANAFKLEHFGLAGRVAELNEAAAAISREAAGPDRHVIASMGGTGKMLLMGDVTEEQLYEAFRDQAVALEKGGADACLIETMTAIDETAIAVKAARENTRLEIICTLTFDKTQKGEYRTMMGVSPTKMTTSLIAAGAHIVGTNCGNGMSRMIPIIREIRSTAPDIPILVHANAGMPVNVNGVVTFPESPDDMAAHAIEAVKAGANVIGGCCGTTPEHIRAIRRVLIR